MPLPLLLVAMLVEAMDWLRALELVRAIRLSTADALLHLKQIRLYRYEYVGLRETTCVRPLKALLQ